jgi:hypothetical protein
MTRMSVRATYALDVETARLVRERAVDWHVSQAKVVRRAVRLAALPAKWAEACIARVRSGNPGWRLPCAAERRDS